MEIPIDLIDTWYYIQIKYPNTKWAYVDKKYNNPTEHNIQQINSYSKWSYQTNQIPNKIPNHS